MMESGAATGTSPWTRSRNFASGADTRLEAVWGIKMRLGSPHHFWGCAVTRGKPPRLHFSNQPQLSAPASPGVQAV